MKKICSTGFKASSVDKKALEHYLLTTPKEWAEAALKGLINKSVKTIVKDYVEIFKKKNPDTIPATLHQLIPLLISMPEFKNYDNEASEKGKADRLEPANIEIWAGGFDIEDYEYDALYAFFKDPEETLRDYMENKIFARKNAMVKESQTKMINDPNVVTIPSRQDDLINLVVGDKDYKNRAAKEAELI